MAEQLVLVFLLPVDAAMQIHCRNSEPFQVTKPLRILAEKN